MQQHPVHKDNTMNTLYLCFLLDRPVYRDVEIISPTSKEQLANKGKITAYTISKAVEYNLKVKP